MPDIFSDATHSSSVWIYQFLSNNLLEVDHLNQTFVFIFSDMNIPLSYIPIDICFQFCFYFNGYNATFFTLHYHSIINITFVCIHGNDVLYIYTLTALKTDQTRCA